MCLFLIYSNFFKYNIVDFNLNGTASVFILNAIGRDLIYEQLIKIGKA